MIKKKVAVILMIVALIFASIAIVAFVVSSNSIISTDNPNAGDDNGNGKIGVTIVPPEVEDKNEGS